MTAPAEPQDPDDPAPVLAPLGPATAARVAGWLQKQGESGPAEVADVTASINAVVRRWVPVPADGQPWPFDKVMGAVMLAGRHYRRRNSPGGVEVFGADGAAYVSRSDPDVAMLLELGPYSPLWVG